MFIKKNMFIKKSKYTSKVFSFVLGSVSIVFILVFIISTIVFAIAYNTFKENNLETALSKLEMFSVSGESTFNEGMAIANNITFESFVDDYRYIKDPLSPSRAFNTYQLINSLQAYTITFRYVDGCFVFFEESEAIVFENYFRYMTDYYDSNYSEIYEDYEGYRDLIFDDEVDYYELRPEWSNEGEELNGYVTLRGTRDEIYAVIKVKFNTRGLYNQMRAIMTENELNAENVGFVAITDSDQQLLMHVGDERLIEHLGDDQYSEFIFEGTKYVSVSVEDNSDFRYTYILPNSIFTRQLNYMTFSFILIFVFLAIVIIAIGFYLMKRHAKSLDHIMDMVDSPEKSESLYQKIDTKIQGLIDDNTLLTNNLKEEKAVLLDMFYEKLLKGSFVSNKELQNNMAVTGSNINGKLFSVGLLCASEEGSESAIDSIAAKNISIKYAANDIIINELFSQVIMCDQIVTVVFVANTDEETFSRNINLFVEKFKHNMQNYNYDYYVCIGGVVEDIMRVKKAYNLSLLMRMKHKNDNNSGHVYKVSPNDIPKDELMEINDTLKNRIYSLVVKGESAATKDLFHKVITTIVKQAKSKSSVTISTYLLWELLIKLINDHNIDASCECYKYYNHYLNLDIYPYNEQITLVSAGFVELSEYFIEVNQSRSDTQLNKILDFINTEFTNPDLSLVYLADKFGISVTKLSKYFKENGIEYSSYITTLRMNHAKHILVNTDTAIKSIANQTGYTSSNSFCRAFKRLEGISANEYRNNNKCI